MPEIHVRLNVSGVILGEASEELLREIENEVKIWADTDLDAETQASLSGQSLRRRTGELARSYRWNLRKSGDDFYIVLTSPMPYAMIHETGGVIRAASGSWLTVPLPAAMSPSGVLYKRSREYKDAFFVTSKSGNLLLVESNGKSITPLFVLKKQVTIPETNWASNAVERAVPRLMGRI